MEKMQSYAFESANSVGEPRPAVRTPLLQKDGHLWLCAPDTFVASGSALVERNDSKSPWKPLETLQALRDFLAGGKDTAQLLGVWTDKAKWGLFGGPDGKIQEKEVETLADRWQGLRLDELVQFEDKGYRSADPHQPPQRCILGWWQMEGQVDGAGVKLLEAAYPDKVVAVLEEPRRIVRHALAWGLRFEPDKGRAALVPTVLSQHVQELEGHSEGGRLKLEECLARGQKEGNPNYVLPIG